MRVEVEVWRSAVPAALVYRIWLPEYEERPVPPLARLSVPLKLGAKVKAPALLVMARDVVRPVVELEEVAKVMAPV